MLYWRDGLDVIKHLFSNPIFASCIDLSPYQEYEETPQGQQRVYGEFMSADCAWNVQVSSVFHTVLLLITITLQTDLPDGHSFLGVIGASDKTPLTIGMGDKEMHPLLLSIANIHAGVRMKATSHSFALAAYLPVPKFLSVSQPVQAVLAARVYHHAISIVTKNLKTAAQDGMVMSDPMDRLRVIHTPLVAWIADYPEQLLIACVSSKNSPISTATGAQFGDPNAHPPRLGKDTLQAIHAACAACDPCDIIAFHKICQQMRLNGVTEPFWEDWKNACPSFFLTPDALHQWHKFYFDHCLQWVINIITGQELNFHLSVLQLRIGTRHWPNGVSTLKQCTGREHRALKKLLPAVSAGAIPDDTLCALRAITEFIFLAQDQFFTTKPYTPLLKHCVSSIIINPAYSLQVVVKERMGHSITFKYQSLSWPSILCAAHGLWVLLISGAATSPSVVISLMSRPHSAYPIDVTTMASVVDSLIDKKNNVFSSSSPASRLRVRRYSTR